MENNEPESKKPENTKDTASQKIVTTITCFLMFSILIIFYDAIGSKIKVITWTFLYAGIISLLSIFSKYRVINVIRAILWIPGAIVDSAGPAIQMLASMTFAYISLFFFTIYVCYQVQNILGYDIKFAAGVYICLTIPSLFATLFAENLIKFFYRIFYKHLPYSDQEALLIFSQARFRYLVFAFYFLLLLVFNFCSFNGIILIQRPGIDLAILQSFATYVAFDRLITQWETVSINRKKETL